MEQGYKARVGAVISAKQGKEYTMAEDIKINNEIVERNARLYQKKTAAELEKYMADSELSDEETKLAELTKDNIFIKSLLDTKDDIQAVKLFAAKGIKMLEEECKEIRKIIVDGISGILTSKEEMSDEELETVTGGSWKGFWKGFKKVAVAALIGAAIGAACVLGPAALGMCFLGGAALGASLGAAAVAAVGGAITGVAKEGIVAGGNAMGLDLPKL